MGEIYGGFLGSHFKGDDIFYCYGNAFGTRIKVIVITKNFRVQDKKSIKSLTTSIHHRYLKSQLDPLADLESHSLSEKFVKDMDELLEPYTCDYEYGVEEEKAETEDKVDSLPEHMKGLTKAPGAGEEKDNLAEIQEVAENLEASIKNSIIEDLGSSMITSNTDIMMNK